MQKELLAPPDRTALCSHNLLGDAGVQVAHPDAPRLLGVPAAPAAASRGARSRLQGHFGHSKDLERGLKGFCHFVCKKSIHSVPGQLSLDYTSEIY